MGVFFIFLWHLWSNFWWFLTSGPLVIEPMLEYLFPSYEDWVNQYISRRKRRQIAYTLSLLGIVAASFFAFEDVYLKLEGKEQEIAQIYRMSGMRGAEESIRSIEKLQVENKQLQSELSSTRDQVSALQASLKPRHLTAEERDKFTAALASHDGQQFGVISVRAIPSCHECMTFVYDIVNAINSIPTWTAHGTGNSLIKVDFSGIGIGMKDTRTPPAGVHVLADALKAAGLQFTIETRDFLAPDKFVLDVGNKP